MIANAVRVGRTAPHIHHIGLASPRWRDEATLVCVFDEAVMIDSEYGRKLDELDRLLNDPDVPMQPDRIWSLLADVSRPAFDADSRDCRRTQK